jgi:hypothetical protein
MRRRLFAIALIMVGVASLAFNLGLMAPSAQRVFEWLRLVGVIIVGLGLILMGEQVWDSEMGPFSVARDQSEGADLLVSAGTADVHLSAAGGGAELVTGELPLPKQPRVEAHEQHTTVRLEPLWGLPSLDRSQWSAALANDLPWLINVRSSTGNLHLDLRALSPAGVCVYSMFGDVELNLPAAGGSDLDLRLIFGDLTVEVPDGLGVKVVLRTGALADVERDERRFIRLAPHEIGTPLYAVAARRCTLDVWLGTGHLRLF